MSKLKSHETLDMLLVKASRNQSCSFPASKTEESTLDHSGPNPGSLGRKEKKKRSRDRRTGKE